MEESPLRARFTPPPLLFLGLQFPVRFLSARPRPPGPLTPVQDPPPHPNHLLLARHQQPHLQPLKTRVLHSAGVEVYLPRLSHFECVRFSRESAGALQAGLRQST